MSAKRLKRQRLKKQLFTKNRLVILNEESFEEIFSLKLNLMNVFVVVTISAILIISITTYIIAFTPLREFIPGYASNKLKKDATILAVKSDSLALEVKKNELYIQSIKKILTGDLEYAKFNKDSILNPENTDISKDNLNPSEEELKLREQVALEDKYNLFEKAQSKVNLVLFPPVRGHITEKYSAKNKHFAIDVAVPKDTPIKSVANGTVVFADWTPSTGNVIIIKHRDAILSVYKHAATLTKTQGDVVRTGEVIGLAGSTGKESTGIHLHFELWKDGFTIDPTQFIDFE
ncbi:M23 family metallopeptidase [Flavobacterium lacus]|uniref:Murein DD-endopeptidase MepM/ murein hydrolase activator NlpD n=1 Tax=Flavobacterium lacus TaxID=1353778 RepID=A0A328X2S8_9FLAO|nr:M23 family metallopeptidase [Flavobacterium lacus]RAR49708.1 murein DD-endopeptidase MepM/ murein hydrolase activator NlpD [Flavobacterium lacus]